jgi:hypothetical protein
MRTKWIAILSGFVLGAVVMAGVPVTAGDGDPMYLGQKNHARRVTKLIGKQGLQIQSSKGIPLRLYSQPGVPPIRVNQTVKVEDLNADLVDGYSAAGLGSRASFNSTDDAPDGADYTLSTQIKAPAAGTLIMTGGIEAVNIFSGNLFHCSLEVNDVPVDGSFRQALLEGDDIELCSTMGAMVVSAGIFTIDLEVGSVSAGTHLSGASVWVTWVPFDGDGNTPVP